MSEQHFIKGRDFALEETLLRMKSGLQSRGISVQERMLENPAPQIWWVQIIHPESGLFTNGKGASALAAQVSGYAEFYERLFSAFFFESSYIQFDNSKWFLHPNEVIPVSKTSWGGVDLGDSIWNHDKEIGLPCENLSNGDLVEVPYQVLTRLTCSNGIAVGASKDEAFVQGLSEIFERYVRFEVLKNAYCLPDIPIEQIQTVLGLEIMEDIHKAGLKLICKDASLGGVYPVIAAALVKEGSCVLSFGAHPQWDVALSRTVTEMFQGRTELSENDFVVPTSDTEEVADPANLESHFVNSTGEIHIQFFGNDPDFEYCLWECPDNRYDEAGFLLNCLAGRPLIQWYREIDGIHIVRLFVEGFSEVYPIDDLHSDLDSLKADTFGLLESLLAGQKGDEAHIEEITSMGGNAFFEVEEFLGVLCTGFPLLQGLTLAELAVLSMLRSGRKDDALHLLEMMVLPMVNDEYRSRLYRIILELDTDYENWNALALLNGEKILLLADKLLSGGLPSEIPASIAELPRVKGTAELYQAYRKAVEG